MNQEDIVNLVTMIFKEVFPELKSKELNLDKKQEEFENWDSFSHMEIISAVEHRFKLSLDTQEVIAIDSPRKLIEIIAKKIQK